MYALFHSRVPEPVPAVEPVPGDFPKIQGAEIAATTYGKRVAGDFYDSLRVSPERILFGLLDVAGRRENNQLILTSAQKIFRTREASFFQDPILMSPRRWLRSAFSSTAESWKPPPGFTPAQHSSAVITKSSARSATPTRGTLRDYYATAPASSNSSPRGCPLGSFPTLPVKLQPLGSKGAVLLLVSRGVVEGKCKDDKTEDQEFGLERVKERLHADSSHAAETLSASILNSVGEFTCEPMMPDDMTALVFMRTG